jgi:DNA-binding transcriptional ArsR family regulator
MDMFTAIAEPTRRNILEMLANSGEMSASDIVRRFSVSPPAISQHLKVLRDAELVEVEKRAQQRIYTINPAKLSELDAWLQKLTKQWEDRFSRLDAILAEEKKKLKGGGTK